MLPTTNLRPFTFLFPRHKLPSGAKSHLLSSSKLKPSCTRSASSSLMIPQHAIEKHMAPSIAGVCFSVCSSITNKLQQPKMPAAWGCYDKASPSKMTWTPLARVGAGVMQPMSALVPVRCSAPSVDSRARSRSFWRSAQGFSSPLPRATHKTAKCKPLPRFRPSSVPRCGVSELCR